MSVISDLEVASGLSVTTTRTLLQESEFHGEDKASTCNNKWQTSAMSVSHTNVHVFTSDCRTDGGLWRRAETQKGGSGVRGVICQITSTDLKPFHRERVTVRQQMVVCVTHPHANTHSQALSHQNPSNRDDSWSLESQGSNKTHRTHFISVSCRRLVTTTILLCTASSL